MRANSLKSSVVLRAAAAFTVAFFLIWLWQVRPDLDATTRSAEPSTGVSGQGLAGQLFEVEKDNPRRADASASESGGSAGLEDFMILLDGVPVEDAWVDAVSLEGQSAQVSFEVEGGRIEHGVLAEISSTDRGILYLVRIGGREYMSIGTPRRIELYSPVGVDLQAVGFGRLAEEALHSLEFFPVAGAEDGRAHSYLYCQEESRRIRETLSVVRAIAKGGNTGMISLSAADIREALPWVGCDFSWNGPGAATVMLPRTGFCCRTPRSSFLRELEFNSGGRGESYSVSLRVESDVGGPPFSLLGVDGDLMKEGSIITYRKFSEQPMIELRLSGMAIIEGRWHLEGEPVKEIKGYCFGRGEVASVSGAEVWTLHTAFSESNFSLDTQSFLIPHPGAGLFCANVVVYLDGEARLSGCIFRGEEVSGIELVAGSRSLEFVDTEMLTGRSNRVDVMVMGRWANEESELLAPRNRISSSLIELELANGRELVTGIPADAGDPHLRLVGDFADAPPMLFLTGDGGSVGRLRWNWIGD